MATLINSTFFQGRLEIAQKTQGAVSTSLQLLIDTLEPEYLDLVLGYELKRDYLIGIALGSPEAKWVNLRDGVEFTNRKGSLDKWPGFKFIEGGMNRSPIANYVYYWYLRKQATATVGSGEKEINAENAENSNSLEKQVSAWAQMVVWNKKLVEYLYVNQETYPQFFNNNCYYERLKTGLFTTGGVNPLNI